jgi:hypothetical protein
MISKLNPKCKPFIEHLEFPTRWPKTYALNNQPFPSQCIIIIATLALGSRPRQRGCKVAGQEEGSPGVKAKALQDCKPKGRKPGNQGKGNTRVRAKKKPRSHITYYRECKEVQGSVREWTFTLPRQLPLWEREPRWTPETSESDLRGQNSMACGVLYINGKLLERRCLKWARIAHLDIWNTSYGQKKGWESNYQFDSRPQKVRNRPDLLSCRWRATYRWKALDESYNFALDRIAIRGLLAKLWGFKVPGVPVDGISGVLGEKNHLDVGPVERCRVYYKGEGGGFPQVRAVVSLVCPCCPWLVLAPKVLQLCINHFLWVMCRPMWMNKLVNSS